MFYVFFFYIIEFLTLPTYFKTFKKKFFENNLAYI